MRLTHGGSLYRRPGADERDGDSVDARHRHPARGVFHGQNGWLAALLFGYVVVVPIVSLLYGDESGREEWWEGWTGEEASRGDGRRTHGG